MGCIFSKGISKEEIVAKVASFKKESIKSLSLSTHSKKESSVSYDLEANHQRSGSSNNIVVLGDDKRRKHGHHRSVTVDANLNKEDISLRSGNVPIKDAIVDPPNGSSGEHASAGWPSWLTSVASEAIKGWSPRRADSFEKLDKIGQGTYSSVYRARDLETGKIVALKKVRFVNMDPESVRFMAREIDILRRLDHPNVIKLEGIVTSRMSCSLYLVFEYMEHDLAGLVMTPGNKFTEPQVKCYMQQLLRGLDHCHSRGILHRDIKGSNLLVDNNGILRIGDFGLATRFDPEKKQPLTSRVVTLWYRPPELLLGATEYGVAVDLWSAGCILAELLAGKPIMPGRTEVEQLHKIFKLCGSPAEDYWKRTKISQSTIFKPQNQYPRCLSETFRDFPSSALKLLDRLLAIEPEERGTASSALRSEFFTTKPLACDPSSLPKFPPSKEYDAKLRDEEARRHKQAAMKGQRAGSGKKGSKNAQEKTTQDTKDAQKKPSNKSSSEKYNPSEDSGAGFPIEPPSVDHSYPRVGSTMHPGAYGNSRVNNKREIENQIVPGTSVNNLMTTKQLRAQRSYMSQYDSVGDLTVLARNQSTSRYNNRYNGVQASEKHSALDLPGSIHNQDQPRNKDSALGYGSKNKRIHYSGPLVPPGGNIDDMLKEHERLIQQAVRKARDGKNKDNF